MDSLRHHISGAGQTSRARRVIQATAVISGVLLVAALAGCSKSSDKSTATTASTTTSPAASAKPAYENRGPYESGVMRLALADGRRVVVWYPAAKSAAAQPTETFDIASLLSPELQAKVPADLRVQYPINTHPGAKAAPGKRFPVVLFSHGYAGFPEQSADLTTHLSSWGFIVVAPDHVERSLDGLLGTAAKGVKPSTDPVVLARSLDLITAEDKRADSPLAGRVDTSKVAVIGHSAGAAAAYLAAGSDPRIKVFISYAVGLQGGRGAAQTPPPPVPTIPGMVMTGNRDGVIPPATSRGVYDGMKAPKRFVEIGNSGHLVFSDICLIGKSKGGLAALAVKAGLNLSESLLRLAKDGCGPGFLDPRKAFPAIDHLTVAFLRSSLGIDPKPVGLDPSVVTKFPGVKLTMLSSPSDTTGSGGPTTTAG